VVQYEGIDATPPQAAARDADEDDNHLGEMLFSVEDLQEWEHAMDEGSYLKWTHARLWAHTT
jgi:hypothetical protein